MGMGSFRVRLFVILVMVLVIWQSVRIWSPSSSDLEISEEIQVKDEPEKNGVQSKFQKVLVTVYYEALCPDSRSFVIKQLEPTFQLLKEHITVQMVPYGKATTTRTGDDYKFTCQHGPVECEANMIHACAIEYIKNPSDQLEFLVCMIRNNLNPQNITKLCGEKMHIDVKPILDCQADIKGKELLAMYGTMTNELTPSVTFIPTITLDKSADNQIAILKNLLDEVCRLYEILPSGCT